MALPSPRTGAALVLRMAPPAWHRPADALGTSPMAKLYFHYSTMNAGKSTSLLQASHNYREGGMATYLITAQFDNRAGDGRIASRIGIAEPADTFAPGENLYRKLQARLATGPVACVFIDEAQFLTRDQVWQLARAVDDLGVPVMAYGCAWIFRATSFPGPPPSSPGRMRCARSAPSATAARRRRWSSAKARMAARCAKAIRS